MKTKLRFFCALVIAAIFGWREGGTCRRLWRMVTLWVDWLWRKDSPVDNAAFEKRMACCRSCPLWYPRLETCGSPLRPKNERGGCWCFMPAAAKLKNKQCWADQELDQPEFGWLFNKVE